MKEAGTYTNFKDLQKACSEEQNYKLQKQVYRNVKNTLLEEGGRIRQNSRQKSNKPNSRGTS